MRRARVLRKPPEEENITHVPDKQNFFLEQNIPLGAFRSTPQGRIISVNPFLAKMIGFASPKEMLESSARDFYLEYDKRNQLLNLLKEKGEVAGFEMLLKRKKIPPIWVSVSAKGICNPNGDLKYMEGIVQDITRRKQAEYELKLERDRAQNYLDIAGVIIVVLNSKGKVTLINQKGQQVLGYKEKEILGKKWSDIFVPKRIRLQVKKVFRKLISGEIEPVEYYENPVVTKSGEERIIAWHNTILRDDDGKITATLSSGLDITERKTAEEKERAYNLYLSFVSRTAIDFVEFDKERNLYEYIGQKLKELIKDAVLIAVTSYDEAQDKFTLMELLSQKKGIRLIMKVMGKNPKGLSFYMREKEKKDLRESRICKISSNLEKVTKGSLSEKFLERIRSPLGFGDILAMGFNRYGKSFGTAVAVMKKGFKLQNREIVEAFINQAAVALQRKHAEDALRESEEKYRSLVENMRKGLIVYDWETDNVVYANKTSEDIFGFQVYSRTQNTRQGLLTKLSRIVLEKEKDELFSTFKTASELRKIGYNETLDFEFRIIRGDGKIRWIYARSYPVQSASLSSTSYIILEDISERKYAEFTLKESEEKYSELFHNSNDAIFIHDPEGNIVDVNQKTLNIFGYSRDEILNLKIKDLHPQDALEQSRMAFEKVTTKGFVNFEIEFKKKNGALFPAEVSSSLFEIGGRKVIQGIVRDITERKRFQEQLIRSSKLVSLGVLAGGIAHQINNPLTTMLFASSALKDVLKKQADLKDTVSDKLMEYIDTLERQIERARMVTSDLLAFAQTRRSEIRPTEIGKVIKKALGFISERLRMNAIELIVEIDPALPKAWADPVALEEVVINLAQNSYEAMKGKGKLYIRGKSNDGESIRLVISDNGPGIPEEIREDIFEPLFSTKHSENGTGLGLPVSAMLLGRFGGRIWFENTPGGGATFVVEIPSENHPNPKNL